MAAALGLDLSGEAPRRPSREAAFLVVRRVSGWIGGEGEAAGRLRPCSISISLRRLTCVLHLPPSSLLFSSNQGRGGGGCGEAMVGGEVWRRETGRWVAARCGGIWERSGMGGTRLDWAGLPVSLLLVQRHLPAESIRLDTPQKKKDIRLDPTYNFSIQVAAS